MTVLLAGGNAALQQSIAGVLAASGDQVRVLGAEPGRAEQPWSRDIEVRPAPSTLSDVGAALDACDAAVIIDPAVVGMSPRRAGPIIETLAQILQEIVARRSVSRLVLVASRHADRFRPHASARLIAELNRSVAGDWSLLQVDSVYGTGDDLVSRYLILMRSLPVIPLGGDAYELQPLWCGDLALAIATCVTHGVAADDRVLELRGPESVTSAQLYERIARLTGRRPARVRLPGFGARLSKGIRAVETAANPNGLPRLGVTPTSLDEGLRLTIDRLPELTPGQGVGSAQIKRFAIDIRGTKYSASELLRAFRARFRELMPIDIGVEPAAPTGTLDEHAVITMTIPGRGHVAIRAQEVAEHHVIVSTLRGHALAGFVRFAARPLDDGVEFEVMPCDTAANVLDWIGLTLGGARLQDANWAKLVKNVASMAGGDVGELRMEERTLSTAEAAEVDRWITDLIHRQSRERSVAS